MLVVVGVMIVVWVVEPSFNNVSRPWLIILNIISRPRLIFLAMAMLSIFQLFHLLTAIILRFVDVFAELHRGIDLSPVGILRFLASHVGDFARTLISWVIFRVNIHGVISLCAAFWHWLVVMRVVHWRFPLSFTLSPIRLIRLLVFLHVLTGMRILGEVLEIFIRSWMRNLSPVWRKAT